MPPHGPSEPDMMGRDVRAPMGARILVADGDPDFGHRLRERLDREGHRTEVATSARDLFDRLDRGLFDAAVVDLGLGAGDGLELLTRARTVSSLAEILAVTSSREAAQRTEAMRRGAFGCLAKPLEPLEVLLSLQRAVRLTRLHREVARLRRRVSGSFGDRLVGRSASLRHTVDLVERVAPTRSTVLVQGEAGVGKEAVARTIHALSPRAHGPFVAVRCSGLSDDRPDAELFGFVEGAFPGAVSGRRGLVEDADGGTLFLDEITALPGSIQAKLLQLLDERRSRRVGDDRWVHLDVRVVAAAEGAVEPAEDPEEGGLRPDLYHHLAVFPIEVPPLRERREDVPLLASHFRTRFADENDVEPPSIPPETMERMLAYDWPGNVRELENFVERALIMNAGRHAIRFELPAGGGPTVGHEVLEQATRAGWDLARLEKAYILEVLEQTGGNQTRAAEILGIDRRTVYRKLNRYRHGDADR